MHMCAENTIKVVSAKIKQKMTKHCPTEKVNIWSRHRSISGPCMLRNITGPEIDL